MKKCEYCGSKCQGVSGVTVMLHSFQTTIVFIVGDRWYKVMSNKRYVREIIKKYGELGFEESDDLNNWSEAVVVVAGEIDKRGNA